MIWYIIIENISKNINLIIFVSSVDAQINNTQIYSLCTIEKCHDLNTIYRLI